MQLHLAVRLWAHLVLAILIPFGTFRRFGSWSEDMNPKWAQTSGTPCCITGIVQWNEQNTGLSKLGFRNILIHLCCYICDLDAIIYIPIFTIFIFSH
jgi:hypothetical protein